MNKTVFQQILERAKKAIAIEQEKFQKEKDLVKQVKIGFKIQRIVEKIVFDELKTRSNKEFDQWIEELTTPFAKQVTLVNTQFEDIAFKTSKTSKDFEKFKKIQSLKKQYVKELFEELDDPDLSKKDLERYLVFTILGSLQMEIQEMKNVIEYNELLRAINLIQRRLNFDHNWFTCMGLIQLHENLLKKKIVELGGEMKGEESINHLINLLSELIKKKENRDVTLDLEMSQGLKKTRDLMSHEGFKHGVRKETLKKITKEIEDLEIILYPEKV